MQTHRRTISSGRIQTYRIKTICLLLSPPATRTHEGVRVFGWVRECLGLLKSAYSDSPSEVNVPIHNSYAPLNGTYPRLDGFALFFRHLSERDNSYSIRCANVGRLLATFFVVRLFILLSGGRPCPDRDHYRRTFWWHLATILTLQRRNHPPNHTVSLSRHYRACLSSHPCWVPKMFKFSKLVHCTCELFHPVTCHEIHFLQGGHHSAPLLPHGAIAVIAVISPYRLLTSCVGILKPVVQVVIRHPEACLQESTIRRFLQLKWRHVALRLFEIPIEPFAIPSVLPQK